MVKSKHERNYPTLNEIEKASKEQLLDWYEHLPQPGGDIEHTLSLDEYIDNFYFSVYFYLLFFIYN